MTANEIRTKRLTAGITSTLLARHAEMDRSKLSHIERGYLDASPQELRKLERALNELVRRKKRVDAYAQRCGWPAAAM
jgi:ribosome-binding protein aMBF1 (putative translation factor)